MSFDHHGNQNGHGPRVRFEVRIDLEYHEHLGAGMAFLARPQEYQVQHVLPWKDWNCTAPRRHDCPRLVYGLVAAFFFGAISARDLRIAMDHEDPAVARVGVGP